MNCYLCHLPLCPACNRCPAEGHDAACPSEEARQRLAAYAKREAEALLRRDGLEEREVGGSKALLIQRIAERFNWGR